MKKIMIFLFSVAMLVLASCSTYKFHTTRIDNVNFGEFKTYAWLPPIDSLSKDYYSNDIAKSKILSTANEDLEARGLTYTKQDPDLLFRYVAIVNNKSKEVYSSNFYYGVGFGWGGPWGSFGLYSPSIPIGKERIRYGHIIIEAIDRKSNTVIWQARGSNQVDSPEKAINEIPKMITGIIKEYPIKAKK